MYKQRCEAVGITMHSRAIPPGEDLTMMQTTLDTSLVVKPPVFMKEGLLEYIMELIVVEDKVCFFILVSVSRFVYIAAGDTVNR